MINRQTKLFNNISLITLAVFLLSLFISSLYVLSNSYGSNLISPYPLSDAALYLHRAWYSAFINADGGFLGKTVSFSPYANLIELGYRTFGSHYVVPLLINCVLFSFSTVFISLLTKEITKSNMASLISGVIFSFSGIFLFYVGLTLKTNLVVTLLSLSLLLISYYFRTKNIKLIIPIIFIMGVAALDRYHLFAALAVFILMQTYELIKDSNEKRFLRLVYISAGMFLVAYVSPWKYNKVEQSFFSPIGLNFYIGNSAEAWGGYFELEGIQNDLVGHRTGLKKYTDSISGQDLNRQQITIYWLNESFNYIKNNPVDFVFLQFKKLGLLFSQYGQGQPEEFRVWRWQRPLLSLAIFDHGLILSLGIIGLFLYYKERGDAFKKYYFTSLLITVFVMTIFFVQERYRVTLCLFFVPFAAFSISKFIQKSSLRRGMLLMLLGLFSVSILSNALINVGGGYTNNTSGLISLIENKRLPNAQNIYKDKVSAVQSNNLHAWINLASYYNSIGFESDSIEFINKAKSINITHPEIYFLLFRIYKKYNNIPKLMSLQKEVKNLYPAFKNTSNEDEFNVLIKQIQSSLNVKPS